MKEPAHRTLHPFGQIPTYEEGDLALFESGAIVFHIAERHAGLLPHAANARARAITWMFAALSTVEPPIVERSMATILERDKTWYQERLALLEDRVHVVGREPRPRAGRAADGRLGVNLYARRVEGGEEAFHLGLAQPPEGPRRHRARHRRASRHRHRRGRCRSPGWRAQTTFHR
jgi:hypothetical protein